MGKRWTCQDVADLKNMAQKYPATVIAEKMDRTVGGVVFKAYQLRVSLKSRQSSEAIGGPGPAGFDWTELD
jgi:hypothetical protein